MTDLTINDGSDSLEVPAEAISEQEYLADTPRVRLRLHHFFVFTAVLSALLVLSRPPEMMGDSQAAFAPAFQKFQQIASAVCQIPAAVAITALAYGIAAQRRGDLWFNQPGHWLIVEIALVALFGIPMSLLMRFVLASPTDARDPRLGLLIVFGVYSFVLLFLGRILINYYLGVKKCRQSRWKSVFYAKIVSVFFAGVGDIAILITLITAARIDRRERLLRNAAHRCGVYVQLAQSILTLLVMIGSISLFFLR